MNLLSLITNAKMNPFKGKGKFNRQPFHAPKEGQGFKKKKHNEQQGEKDFKCFHCKKKGHKRANCYKFKAWIAKKENSQGELLVCFELNLVDIPLNSWWLDCGATDHVMTTL